MKQITITISDETMKGLRKIASNWRKFKNPEDATAEDVANYFLEEDIKEQFRDSFNRLVQSGRLGESL